MRTISLDGMKQLFKQEAEDVFLCILDITHSQLTEHVRLVNDIVDLEYNGNIYTALPFKFVIPPDVKDKVPSAKIILDNINRELISLLRSTDEAPYLEVNIVRKDISDNVTKEIGPFNFRMNNITYTATTLEAELGFDADFLNESAVADYFTPHLFPGLF